MCQDKAGIFQFLEQIAPLPGKHFQPSFLIRFHLGNLKHNIWALNPSHRSYPVILTMIYVLKYCHAKILKGISILSTKLGVQYEMKILRCGGDILCFDLNNTRESELQLFSFIEEGLRGLIRSWNGLFFWENAAIKCALFFGPRLVITCKTSRYLMITDQCDTKNISGV